MRAPAIDVHARSFPEPDLELIVDFRVDRGCDRPRDIVEQLLRGNAARVLGLR